MREFVDENQSSFESWSFRSHRCPESWQTGQVASCEPHGGTEPRSHTHHQRTRDHHHTVFARAPIELDSTMPEKGISRLCTHIISKIYCAASATSRGRMFLIRTSPSRLNAAATCQRCTMVSDVTPVSLHQRIDVQMVMNLLSCVPGMVGQP